MPRLSVCIEMVFSELPFLRRIEQVASAGFSAFEFWTWAGKDLDGVRAEKERLGLAVAAMAWGSSRPSVAERLRWGGLVDLPDHDDCLSGVEESIEVARDLGCPNVLLLVGNTKPYLSSEAQHKNVVEGLRAAARIADGTGVTLAIEPLNILVDHPGYFLTSSTEACAIVREVGSRQVKLLFDVYHQQISEGNITANLVGNIDLVAHIHVADVPGRHQPGTGELNYAYVMRRLEDVGYGGYVGLECELTGDTGTSLAQASRLLGTG